MIIQHRIQLKPGEMPVGATLAYPLYAWLLSHLSQERGDALHEQSIHPISQYVHRDGVQVQWIVNLLTDEAIEWFHPILEKESAAQLRQGIVEFGERTVETIASAQTLIARAQNLSEDRRFALEMATPTAFKQNSRYTIFPQESLILQSLVHRWESCFPELPLDDADAMLAMLAGVHIVDYRLHTLRYPLKQTRIPSFQGRIILESHLPVPLMEILKALYVFAPYAGLGIKTALGMGGVKIGQPNSFDI